MHKNFPPLGNLIIPRRRNSTNKSWTYGKQNLGHWSSSWNGNLNVLVWMRRGTGLAGWADQRSTLHLLSFNKPLGRASAWWLVLWSRGEARRRGNCFI